MGGNTNRAGGCGQWQVLDIPFIQSPSIYIWVDDIDEAEAEEEE